MTSTSCSHLRAREQGNDDQVAGALKQPADANWVLGFKEGGQQSREVWTAAQRLDRTSGMLELSRSVVS